MSRVAPKRALGQHFLYANLANAQSKQDVLDLIAQQFMLPAHFGKNFDALYDCMTDPLHKSGPQPGFIVVLEQIPATAKFDKLEGAADGKGIVVLLEKGAGAEERKRAEALIAFTAAARGFYTTAFGPPPDVPLHRAGRSSDRSRPVAGRASDRPSRLANICLFA